jgi:hypothetical protein
MIHNKILEKIKYRALILLIPLMIYIISIILICINIKNNIWVDDFDTEEELLVREDDFILKGVYYMWTSGYIYSGLTSELKEIYNEYEEFKEIFLNLKKYCIVYYKNKLL